jgi:tight adherence protein C
VINPALTGLAGVCCCAVGLRGAVLLWGSSALERRELSDPVVRPDRRRGPTRLLVDAVGARLGPRLLLRMGESRRAKALARLDRAGRPAGLSLERYAELRAATAAIAVVFAVFVLALGSWLLALLFALIGWFGVDAWLARTGRRRQARLERDMPDFIDILAITVRAGVGYRGALERVATSLAGPPAEEILTTLRQMDLGATRREAFEALRARNDSRTLDRFVAVQLQAEELGVPLADALGSIAADTRREAQQTARRRAQRTVPKLTLITITLVLPATMLLIAVGLLLGSLTTFPHLG